MASPATCSHTGHGGSMPKPVLVGEPGATGSRVLSGKDLRIGIVSTRWYDDEIVGPLTEACSKELQDKGVAASDIIVVQVSGAFELPFAAMRLIDAEGDRLDAVVCIGCMVKGRTMAYEFVSEAVTMGIMKLNVKTDTPVIFGVLTVASEEDAKACAAARGSCGGSSAKCSHGVEWAQSALEMARLKHATAPKIAGKCKCQCHCETKDCSCACHCSKCDCNACSCSDCKCTSCKGSRGVGKSGAKSSSAKICSQCGDETDNCRCEKCMCKECCNKLASQTAHAEDKKCSQCGDEVASCRCKDCKCTGCCAKGTAASETKEEDDPHICSTCGTAADQCQCTDCQCSGCRSGKGAKRMTGKQCGDCCKA